MRAAATFSRATPADAAELAAGLRPSDAEEMALFSGLGAADGVALSCFLSDALLAARVGGRLFCVFGGVRESALSREGTIWALATREAEKCPRDFARGSREGLGLVLEAMPDVETWGNWVLAGNEASRRWLDWLGAYWTGGVIATPFGGVFRRFQIER